MPASGIYLGANANTSVMPVARAAAIAAIADDFGNPSSIHGAGLKARAMMDDVRTCVRRVLGVPTGQLLFLCGATEGAQTVLLTALTVLTSQQDRGAAMPRLLLYGATEHKASPHASHQWGQLLNFDLEVLAIPGGVTAGTASSGCAAKCLGRRSSAPWPPTSRRAWSATRTASSAP